MKSKRIIGTYYFLSAVSAFGGSFVFATYVTFLLSRGLNLFEVNLVNAVYMATITLAEIPTGAIADVYGRKISYFFSDLLVGLGFFVYGLSGSLPGFLIAEVLAGIGSTCESGAYQAWLVDSLSHAGHNGSTRKIFSVENAISRVTGVIASILGALIAGYNQSLPWFLGGGILLFSSLLTLILMKEEYFERQKYSISARLDEMKQTVKSSARYASRNSVVRFLLLIGVVHLIAIQAANMQWQPKYMIPHHLVYLGLIWGGIALFSGVGGLLSTKFLNRVGDEQKALIWAQILVGVGIALAGAITPIVPSLSIFLLHESARGLFKPVHDTYLNDNIPSKERATIISCISMVTRFGAMAGLLLSGALVVRTSIPTTWIVTGSFLVVISFFLPKNGKRS